MQTIELKYGCNPNQTPARVYMENGGLPIKVLNGRPGYINLLDALNGYQLVRELRLALNLPAAASFKHVSPAGAAVGMPLDDTLRRAYFAGEGELSLLACAYVRARGADRMSSFGDFIALSDICDVSTAVCIKKEVSDGVIAPGYDREALDILRKKRNGGYTVLQIDENYVPDLIEIKHVYGGTFEQRRNDLEITADLLSNIVTNNKELPNSAVRDLILALIALKYTQSNSVCYASSGQTIGVGAGQQSRIHCTRLAGNKADIWHLRQHPKTLGLKFKKGIGRADRDNSIDLYLSDAEYGDVLDDGKWQDIFEERPAPMTSDEKREWLTGFNDVSLGSDAFFPFGDNIERAHRSGVKYIAQPGGSIRDDQVIATCDKYAMVMALTGARLFHH